MSYEGRPLDEKYQKLLKEWLPSHFFTHEYGPTNYIMPENYGDILRRLDDLEVREDDVWMTGFLRTGTTRTMEMIWLILNGLNFDMARSIPHFRRVPSPEIAAFESPDSPKRMLGMDPFDYIRDMKSPRCIRTHAPYDMLPAQVKTVKPKIIYTLRNPKDVWCSFHPVMETFFGMKAPLEESARLFCEGKMPRGSYIDHCLSTWKARNESNVYIVVYEDMIADTKGGIRKLAEFLEKPLSDEQIEKLEEFVSLESMKKNPGVNMKDLVEQGGEKQEFIRVGKAGGWKNKLSPEVSAMFDKWIEEKTKGTDLKFKGL